MIIIKRQLIIIGIVFLFSSEAYAQKIGEQVDWDKIENRLLEDLKTKGGKSESEIHQAIGYGLLESDNNWERAVIHFKKAVELNPHDAWSWNTLGMIYIDTEEGNEYF